LSAVADRLKAVFRDPSIWNRHKAVVTAPVTADKVYDFYATKTGSRTFLPDMMYSYWKNYVRKGSQTVVQGESVGDPEVVNTVAPLGSTTSLIGITSAIGANESAVVNYVYQDIGWRVGDLEYSLDGGASWSLVPTKPFTTSFTATVSPTYRTTTITGLTNGELYSISLRAVDFYDQTESFVPAAAPMPVRPNVSAVPDAPSNLTVTKTKTTATVGFDLPASGTSAITNYQYSLNDGSTWSNVASFNLYGATVSGLTEGTTYSISVRAVNAVGSGTASSSISVTTNGTSAAPTPAFRSASNSSSGPNIANGVTSVSTDVPTGVVSGDILVLIISIAYNGKAGVSGTPPSGWTQRVLVDGPTGNYSSYLFGVYTKTAGASETSAVWTGGGNWMNVQTAMIAVSDASAVDVVGSTSSNLVAPSVTTTSAKTVLIGAWGFTAGGQSGGPYLGVPSPMVSRNSQFGDFGVYRELTVATQTLSTAGATGTRTGDYSANGLYPDTNAVNSVLLAIK